MSYTYLNSEEKAKAYTEFGGAAANTGSTPAQVVILTKRINHLASHLRTNSKDHVTRRSLLRLVGQRRKLLRYYAAHDILAYRTLIQKLEIRDTIK